MTADEELQWFREREQHVRLLRSIAYRAVYELGSSLLRTDLTAALNALDDYKSSPRSVTVGKRPPRPASRVRDPKSKGGESARREDVLVDGTDPEPWVGGLTSDRVTTAEFVRADGEPGVCSVCHRTCLSEMHSECEREVTAR